MERLQLEHKSVAHSVDIKSFIRIQKRAETDISKTICTGKYI